MCSAVSSSSGIEAQIISSFLYDLNDCEKIFDVCLGKELPWKLEARCCLVAFIL